MRLLTELRRRNVFKVAAAYGIVSWLLLQVSDTLVPALRLPEWFQSGVVFILILGFPIAMIFAWAFEMTPEGLKKETTVDPDRPVAAATGQKMNQAIIALLVVALAYFAWDKFATGPHTEVARTALGPSTEASDTGETLGTTQPRQKSIAVIPFRNRSANEENATFFSEGIHDELLTNLSKIKALTVISRTSVMAYRDTTKNLRQIGMELGVANILEGGVQRANDTVRINVQLIDTATDAHLWANVYERELTAENIFAIQKEIAEAIANALEATLSPQEQARLADIPTTSLEAYENLLLARQLYNRGNWQSLRDAQTYLHQAIEFDPAFGEAHVLLARTYFALIDTGATNLQEIEAGWQQAIEAALSLNPGNATAYATRAQFLWMNGLEGAQENFEKARQLESGNADIMTMYGLYLRGKFDLDRALPLYEMARRLDPLSIRILFGLARIHEARREIRAGLETYARIREIDPSSYSGYGPVSALYMLTGDMVQSANWIFQAAAIDPDDSEIQAWVARVYLDFSDYDRTRQWLSRTERTQSINPMTPAGWAMLHIYQGDIDASMSYTRQALESRMLNRYGSDGILVRALLIWALDQDRTDTALTMLRQVHPELFEQKPLLDANNILQAIDAAHLLQKEQQNGDAEKLLQAVLAAYERPYAVAQPWLYTGKAQALAMLGETRAALDELRRQVDEGWRIFWRWDTELNPNFESLRDEPEFKALVEFLRTDMARQRQSLRALEASGDIHAPRLPGTR